MSNPYNPPEPNPTLYILDFIWPKSRRYLNLGGKRSNLSSIPFKPKYIAAQPIPEWPLLIKLFTMTDLIIDFENCKFTAKDLELI